MICLLDIVHLSPEHYEVDIYLNGKKIDSVPNLDIEEFKIRAIFDDSKCKFETKHTYLYEDQ